MPITQFYLDVGASLRDDLAQSLHLRDGKIVFQLWGRRIMSQT
jgi:hypothetical protein